MSVISIDWATKIISIPRDYMTIVQLTPIEIRELNINQFRLDLKALEASEIGMTFLDTHHHNTEVLLGGIVYAMVVEIINGYTVTFEDGSYAVNLIGANSNIGDVVNLNTVSVRSNNAAGLISNAAIEYASFNGGVTVDVTSANTGTVFPTGTPQKPVNNIIDAMLIASVRGFTRLYIIGDIELDIGDDVSGMTLVGQSRNESSIIVHGGSTVTNAQFNNATINGEFDGMAVIESCIVENIDFFDGTLEECMITGTIRLLGFGKTNLRNCYDGLPGLGTPIIDCNGDGQDVGVWGYYGGLVIQNKTGDDSISVNLATGRLVIDPTVTNGEILVKGVGLCEDNSTGTTNVNIDGLISKTAVASAVEEEIGNEIQYAAYQNKVWIDIGSAFSGTVYPTGTPLQPVNNLTDAMSIATTRGFMTFFTMSDLTIPTGVDITNLTFTSDSWPSVTIEAGVVMDNAIFEKLSLYGVFGALWNTLVDCWVYDITNFCGWMRGGSFEKITLAPYTPESLGQSFFDSVLPMYPGIPSVLTMNTDTSASFTNAIDTYQINEMTSGSQLVFGLGHGKLILDSSCIGGDIVVRGVGLCDDNSTGTTVDTAGLISTESVAKLSMDAVYIDVINGEPGTTFPIGTPTKPVDNLADARIISDILNIKKYKINGTLTIDTIHEGFTFTGIGSILNDIITISDVSVAHSKFERCTVTGIVSGIDVQYENCALTDISGVQGLAIDTSVYGTIALAPSSTFTGRNISGTTPIVNLVGGGGHLVQFGGVGGFTITNAVNTDMVQIGISMGSVTIDTTCTAGAIIAVVGDCTITDNSTGAIVVDGTTVKRVWDTQPQIG